MIITIVVSVLVLFIVFAFYKASQLKQIEITNSVIINGSKKEVFDMVKYLNNFPKWSPFLAQDPGQKYMVKGEDGAIGAQYHWDGNDGKDLGYQELVKVNEYSAIAMRCDIQKPFVAHPSFEYSFAGQDGSVKVTQEFKLSSSMVDALFMWLFGAKGKMDATNELGMELLKKAVEKG